MSQQWQPQQEAAIEARHGEAIVVAGAGSGKTGVLSECVAQSAVNDGLSPDSILAITFTRKAAAEMRRRIRRRSLELLRDRDGLTTLPQIPEKEPEISTIDAFCQGLVRRNALELGIDPRFEVVDDTDPDLTQAAWEAALAAVGETLGTDLLEYLAKYDDNPRAPLEKNLRSVYGRLRTGGMDSPRIEVPDRVELEEKVAVLFAEAQSLANDFIKESAGWRELATLDKARDLAERITGLSFSQVGEAPESFVPKPGKIKELVDSEVRPALNECLGRLSGARSNLLALPDLEVTAQLLAAYSNAMQQVKAAAGQLDFQDLVLLSLRLLDERKAAHAGDGDWRPAGAQFARVFVDEAQDINRLQARLIELLAPDGKYYSVGDAAQSIYRFRHADVEIFEERSRALAAVGRRFELSTNYRSLSPILDVNNHVFTTQEMRGLIELVPFEDNKAEDLRVEMILADADRVKERLNDIDDAPEWLEDVVDSGWRYVEAAAVAERISDLIERDGRSASEITILSRAVKGLIPFAEALRSRGIPATIEGAGGLWLRPEVGDLVSLLAVTGNARHGERLYRLLHSRICGLSLDGLVQVAHYSRANDLQPLDALAKISTLSAEDAEVRDRFIPWFERQRALAGRRSLSDAIEAALVETGYDMYLLGLPAGDRRFANVRRMQALASEWEAVHGADPAAFAREADSRAASEDNKRDGEAVVEQSPGSDSAVRLMTVHQAKGLQFPVTVLVDLGRGSNSDKSVLTVSPDGKQIAFRWRELIGSSGKSTFANAEFEEAEALADAEEELRVTYVGFTRPQELLILSGAFDGSLKDEPKPVGSGGKDSNLSRLIDSGLLPGLQSWCLDTSVGDWTETYENGSSLRVRVDGGEALDRLAGSTATQAAKSGAPDLHAEPGAIDPEPVTTRPSGLSYSGLQTASRCAYRWYAEEIVGLSPVGVAREGGSGEKTLRPADRGTVLHGLLENAALDGAPPTPADADREAGVRGLEISEDDAKLIADLASGVMASATWARLGEVAANGGRVAREEGFAVAIPGVDVPLRGVLDVFTLVADDSALVIDWKTSSKAIEAASIDELAAEEYGIQRHAYAYAALSSSRSGVPVSNVEVVHLYAERPDEPASASFTSADLEMLGTTLADMALPLLAGEISVTDKPWASVCNGCPAKGRICPVPVADTERTSRPS